MTRRNNTSILNDYDIYYLYIYILSIIRFFFVQHLLVYFDMNIYANQYNKLQFFYKNMDMIVLLNLYITDNPSLIARQSKCISLR